MNRKLALAASVSAAVTLVSGAVTLGALLSSPPEEHAAPQLTDATLAPGSATVTSLDPVVVYQDEYEYVATGGQPPAAGSSGTGPSGASDAPVAANARGTSSSEPGPSATAAPTPTTAAPLPVTTNTTRTPGVPRDWPADKPIPPMPANCRQPQLEDNGVWNCQN
jgi:hypothetical protein